MRSPMSSITALDILKSNGHTTFSVYGPCHWNSLSVYPSSLTLVLFILFFHHLYSFIFTCNCLIPATQYEVEITTIVKEYILKSFYFKEA